MKTLTTVLLLTVTLLTGCRKNTDAVAPATTTFPQILDPGV